MFALIAVLMAVDTVIDYRQNGSMVAQTFEIVVFAMALAFNPLRSISERLAARLFYRGLVDPRQAFSNLSVAISQAIHLPSLVDLLVTEVPRAFGCSGGACGPQAIAAAASGHVKRARNARPI